MFKSGDIVYGDVGYNTVCPVWYEVIRATEKTAWVRKLATYIVDADVWGQSGTKMPRAGIYVPNGYMSDNEGNHRHKVIVDKNGNSYIRIHNTKFTIWDGKAKDFDTYD